MSWHGYAQIVLYFAVLVALVKPLGGYMARVYEGEPHRARQGASARSSASSIASCGVPHDAEKREMKWTTYAVAMLLFNVVGHRRRLRASSGCRASCRSTRRAWARSRPISSLNTAVSFATNTNWQSYGGERR